MTIKSFLLRELWLKISRFLKTECLQTYHYKHLIADEDCAIQSKALSTKKFSDLVTRTIVSAFIHQGMSVHNHI